MGLGLEDALGLRLGLALAAGLQLELTAGDLLALAPSTPFCNSHAPERHSECIIPACMCVTWHTVFVKWALKQVAGAMGATLR